MTNFFRITIACLASFSCSLHAEEISAPVVASLLGGGCIKVSDLCLPKTLSPGEYVFSAEKKKIKVKVVVTIGKSLPHDDSFRICPEYLQTCYPTKKLAVYINEKNVFIPVDAFVTLNNISSESSVIVEESGVILKIIGGDASESYIVEMEFNKEWILKRRLFSGLAPEFVMEETAYHYHEQQ